MTTITKEKLIELLQHRISVAAKYPDIEEAQIDATVFKIALASVEATPIYQVDYGNDWRDVERVQYDDHAVHGSPARIVYAAPPAPVSEPAISDNSIHDLFLRAKAMMYQSGGSPIEHSLNPVDAWLFEAEEATMKQAEPVSPTYKLHDGWGVLR
ncbi:Uncharacterised protein [Edwardsiella tarda]|nr:Uncharacterised protein [Edwardsiella tarda]